MSLGLAAAVFRRLMSRKNRLPVLRRNSEFNRQEQGLYSTGTDESWAKQVSLMRPAERSQSTVARPLATAPRRKMKLTLPMHL
jgi:hypothetical protein